MRQLILCCMQDIALEFPSKQALRSHPAMSSAEQQEREFAPRLDIYWRALALYTLALLGYGFVRSGLRNEVAIPLSDPLALLLLLFALWALLALVWTWYVQPRVGLGADYVRIRNRFRERVIPAQEIRRIVLPRRYGWGRLVRIYLRGRRRVLLLRPAAYAEGRELLQGLARLQRRLQ